MTRHGTVLPIPDEAHCDICGERPAVFALGSPLADWGYFCLLCERHNTLPERIKCRLQWAWARWSP